MKEQKIIDTLREIIVQIAPDALEREMYGGLVYELTGTRPKRLFAGIFKRKGYVTVEFDKGAELNDPTGVLEGSGKTRRHIKLKEFTDIEDKNIKYYFVESLNQQ